MNPCDARYANPGSVAGTPAWRFALQPAHGHQAESQQRKTDPEHDGISRRSQETNDQGNTRRIDGQANPTLPPNRQAPTPAVALGGKPVVLLAIHFQLP